MSQMERGERPTMQEQEDSEEGEPPADPSAGEWLPARSFSSVIRSRPWTDALASCVQEEVHLQVLGPPGSPG